MKIWLAEIDAPEKKQPFGTQSKQSLGDLCANKSIEVIPEATDRYGRTIAHIHCGGLDVSIEQIRRGQVWVYDRYVKDRNLYALQEQAKVARRGLCGLIPIL